ncbi:MAG: hypothetical protein M0C28_32575 [Candidatus Moduliflexus flocculans]|nr:hypothetical protein [Candidatus Moduliflexus flocculans]
MKNAGHEPQFMTLSVVGPEALAADLAEAGRGVGISQVVPYPRVDTLPVLAEYRDIYVRGAKGVPSVHQPRGLHRRQGSGRRPAPSPARNSRARSSCRRWSRCANTMPAA